MRSTGVALRHVLGRLGPANVRLSIRIVTGKTEIVRFQLLPSTFEENGRASPRQHLTCFVIDDTIAFDAGSLAMAEPDS
jgi:hypothetical protein